MMERITLMLILLMLLSCLLFVFSSGAAQAAETVEWLPDDEVAVLSDVASQYALNDIEAKLLYAIRRIENGTRGGGREMGVLTPQAQRYKGDFKRSLRLQAEYTAGTIKKRFRGNLEAFAARWCPIGCDTDNGTNKHWLKNVRYYMERS